MSEFFSRPPRCSVLGASYFLLRKCSQHCKDEAAKTITQRTHCGHTDERTTSDRFESIQSVSQSLSFVRSMPPLFSLFTSFVLPSSRNLQFRNFFSMPPTHKEKQQKNRLDERATKIYLLVYCIFTKQLVSDLKFETREREKENFCPGLRRDNNLRTLLWSAVVEIFARRELASKARCQRMRKRRRRRVEIRKLIHSATKLKI